MKIYISHASNYDYKNDIYDVLKSSDLFLKHKFYLPHDNDNIINTKDVIKDCDLVIGEVSVLSIGVGIELGWADSFNKRIVCLYKEGLDISSALSCITNEIYEYSDLIDIIKKVVGE